MKRPVLLIALVILSFTKLSHAQSYYQLQAGVFIYDTILVYNDNFTTTCGNSAQFRYSVDSSLTPVATGVNLELVVSQLTGTVTNNVTGTVHLNDVYPFTLSNQTYNFYSTASATMKLKLIVTGTPTVPQQKYQCAFGGYTGGTCPYTQSFFGNDTCEVGMANGVTGVKNSSVISVYNGSGSIHLQYESLMMQAVTFHLYNLLGQEVISTTFYDKSQTTEIPASKLCSGLYIWEVTEADGTKETGKLVR
jgi:hypothetical protein